MADNFGKWITDCLEAWSNKIGELPAGHHARLSLGSWIFAYSIEGGKIAQEDILDIVIASREARTGWPPFWVPTRPEIAPRLYGNVLECWLGGDGRIEDPSHDDYWRVSSSANAFLIRGHQEDGLDFDQEHHGKTLDLTLPIWRLGEALLQANKFARVVSGEGEQVSFSVKWSGLKDRKLRTIANKRRMIEDDFIAKKNVVEHSGTFNSSLREDWILTAVEPVIHKLYGSFNMFSYYKKLVEEELLLMLSNRYGNK